MMSKINIKIPSKHYVGMVKRKDGKIPLAFATPYGEDSAAQKRIETVDEWVKSNARWSGNTAFPGTVIENIPLSGFRLTSDIRSSSYGGLDKWRIEDPRGFELEISSGNLARLLSVGMIDRGEITDQCVWGRDGANNVLISVNTEEYKSAVENTKVAGLKTDWRTAKPGNTVLLQNNFRGVWLGRMYPMIRHRTKIDASVGTSDIASSDKSLHVIFVNTPTENGKYTRQIHLIANPKLASIEDDSSISEAEAEKLANEMISDPTCSLFQNSYRTVIALTFGSVQPIRDFSLSTRPIRIEDHDELHAIAVDYTRRDHVYATDLDGNFGCIGRRYDYGNRNAIGIECYDVDKLAFADLCVINEAKSSDGYWGRSNVVWNEKYVQHTWDSKVDYVQLVLTIKTKNGNVIESLL